MHRHTRMCIHMACTHVFQMTNGCPTSVSHAPARCHSTFTPRIPCHPTPTVLPLFRTDLRARTHTHAHSHGLTPLAHLALLLPGQGFRNVNSYAQHTSLGLSVAPPLPLTPTCLLPNPKPSTLHLSVKRSVLALPSLNPKRAQRPNPKAFPSRACAFDAHPTSRSSYLTLTRVKSFN